MTLSYVPSPRTSVSHPQTGTMPHASKHYCGTNTRKVLSVTRKMQIKPRRHHRAATGTATITIKDMERYRGRGRAESRTLVRCQQDSAGRCRPWASLTVPQRITHEIPTRPSKSALRYVPKRTNNRRSNKDLHTELRHRASPRRGNNPNVHQQTGG